MTDNHVLLSVCESVVVLSGQNFTCMFLQPVFYVTCLVQWTLIVRVMKEVICDTSINNCHKPIKLYLFFAPTTSSAPTTASICY